MNTAATVDACTAVRLRPSSGSNDRVILAERATVEPEVVRLYGVEGVEGYLQLTYLYGYWYSHGYPDTDGIAYKAIDIYPGDRNA